MRGTDVSTLRVLSTNISRMGPVCATSMDHVWYDIFSTKRVRGFSIVNPCAARPHKRNWHQLPGVHAT